MTDIELYQPPASAAAPALLEIDSWTAVAGQVIRLAKEIADTPFVPDGLRGSVPATAAAILAGRELGLGPMTSLANVHVIKGKPALSAALMRALILGQGHQLETIDITDTRAVVRGRRKGEANWEEASFTADQAKRANIQLGGYPQDKLYARATSRLARRKFADVIAGMPYSAEELEDGVSDDEPQPAKTEPPKAAARTAQRRKPPAAVPPEPPLPQETSDPQDAAEPPLPGEDEPDDTDYDTPGTVTKPQLTKLAVVFGELGFQRDEREQRLAVASQLARRELESSAGLSRNEAHELIDTLSRCEGDRDKLIALLTEGEAPDA